MRSRGVSCTWLVACLLSVGCGSSGSNGGAGPPPPLDVDASVGSLTDAQKAALCDWGNDALLGGYGKKQYCGQEYVSSSPDQATCIAHLPDSCTLPVGQYEDCMEHSGGTACGFLDYPPCLTVLAACGPAQ